LRNRTKEKNDLKRWIPAVLFSMMAVMISAASCGISSGTEYNREGVFQAEGASVEISSETGQETKAAPEEVYVHVCGAVKKAGLYKLPAGARVGDAVDKAGGFTKNANQDAVNLAAFLSDGQQIYIPYESEAARSGPVPSSEDSLPDTGQNRVNINTAQEAELTSLSGIGESKALAILEYRREHGSFSSPEDIRNVPGIGDGIYNRIKDLITV
jgi:competence protein ComEA